MSDHAVLFRLHPSDLNRSHHDEIWGLRFKAIKSELYDSSIRRDADIAYTQMLGDILDFFRETSHEVGPSLIMRIGDDILLEYNYPMCLTQKQLFICGGGIRRQVFFEGRELHRGNITFNDLMDEVKSLSGKPFNSNDTGECVCGSVPDSKATI